MSDLFIDIKKRVDGFDLSVTWEIGKELAVLFGHSGAGKSMTLQIISGLMKPDTGYVRCGDRVYFDDRKTVDLSPQKRSIGYVFQDLALFPHMTVRENILYGVRGLERTTRREMADRMVRTFHLEGLDKKHPMEISGGQKQRVALARALITKPSLLLLDEPFSALDSALRTEMRDLIVKIREDFNVPIVLVTHDIEEAYCMADRVIVYSKGSVVQSGSPDEVFSGLPRSDLIHRGLSGVLCGGPAQGRSWS